MALQLAVEKDARVALVDRNEKLGQEVLARLRKLLQQKGLSESEAAKRAIFIKADLASMDDVERAYKVTIETFGGLDVAVNNGKIISTVSLHGRRLMNETSSWGLGSRVVC